MRDHKLYLTGSPEFTLQPPGYPTAQTPTARGADRRPGVFAAPFRVAHPVAFPDFLYIRHSTLPPFSVGESSYIINLSKPSHKIPPSE